MTTASLPLFTPQEASVAAVVDAASQLGVDPILALAIAQQESGFNPTAVGDHGTSFGLYQLHQGGELGSLTAAQADNPLTNASVALSQVAAVAKANPGASPGEIAALAQRPADPAAYAASINGLYNQAKQGLGPVATLVDQTGSQLTGTAYLTGSGGLSGVIGAIWNAIKPGAIVGIAGNAVGGAVGSAASSAASSVASSLAPVLLKVAFVVGGLVLIVLGLSRMFPGVTNAVTTTATGAAAAAA